MILNFSGIDSQSRIGALLRLPLRLIPHGLVLPIMQGPLKGKRWIAASSNHGCWLGTYELRKQMEIARALAPGMTVYDIGANVGFYTLLASTLVGASGEVHAFEPVPRNFELLERHLRINRISNVHANRAAVASSNGLRPFAMESDYSMGHLADRGNAQVQTITLDGYLRDTKSAPAVLKIDVEGAEAEVLKGGRRLLHEHHPVIFLATHGEAVHRECCELLESAGYSLSSLDGRSANLTDEIVARGSFALHPCFDV